MLTISQASSKNNGTWEKSRLQALNILENRNCGDAWDILWPFAKNGNADARLILAGALIGLGLNPPGQTSDQKGWKKTFLTLAIHGYSPEERFAVDMVPQMLLSKDTKQPEGAEVASCFVGKSDVELCRYLSVKLNVVESFGTFARSVDLSKAKSLTCFHAKQSSSL